MGIEIAKQLAEFSVKTKLADIPPKTMEFIKGLALKTVAGMLVGSTMPVGKRVNKAAKERGHLPEVGVMGSGYKTSLWNAVLNNGLFAHGAELEDDSFLRGTAWDITTFPVYFPLAEKLGLSGQELAEVCAVGLEVHSRTTLFYPQGYLGLSVIPGVMGPAAGVARAMQLNEAETISAMGLALSGVPVAYVSFGTDAHYYETSLHCLQALVAAELAKEGLASNPDIVTYMTHLLGQDRVVPEKFVEKLGKEWRVHDIWIKKYPCCFYMHRHLDALLELAQQEKISCDQVERITVHISKLEEVCNRPEPKSIGDLQFSFHHALSAILLDKDVNFNHVALERIDDPKFKEARKKVEILNHPEWVPKYGMDTPARIDVQLKDGRVFSRERMHSIGAPPEPLTMEQFKALFAKFTQGILPTEKIGWTADALGNLEKLTKKDMQELNKVLVFGSTR
ncbi:MAG: MmgE/PrpD family protein [Proteobacteria bacterium]|nr:MmgE/PrpD family protein [Pseudomonadota bacterium]